MSKFVVDANVAIKWILPEIYSWEALELLQNEENQLLVPDFFFSECGNILWKRVRRGEIDLITSQQYLNEIIAVNLQIYQSSQLVPLALEIAVRIQQAVYDCVYLALAVQKSCLMVTADERFFNALQGDSLASYLFWIGTSRSYS